MYQEIFMREAIRQAKKAAQIDETPIGAVIVRDGKIISRGYNKREIKKNSLCHAEIIAINRACRKLGGWRLPGCTLYVTLEPCPMCAGAIIQSRIEQVYFGAYDEKNGCAGSAADLFRPGLFNHDTAVSGGHMEPECRQLLPDFFRELRRRRKTQTSKNNIQKNS